MSIRQFVWNTLFAWRRNKAQVTPSFVINDTDLAVCETKPVQFFVLGAIAAAKNCRPPQQDVILDDIAFALACEPSALQFLVKGQGEPSAQESANDMSVPDYRAYAADQLLVAE